MAMFGGSKKEEHRDIQQEIQKAESEAISSIIDESMKIVGEVSFQGKTRIDGIIEGNINGEHVILSETGKITGNVQASSFNCFGTIKGDVKASMITARKDCYIQGKLEAGSLIVEPGAALDGEIKTARKDSGGKVTKLAQTPAAAPIKATSEN